MKQQELNTKLKKFYWRSPVVGIACSIITSLIFIIILESFSLYSPGGWINLDGIYIGVIILFNGVAIPIAMLVSYLYLIMLNKAPGLYGLLSSIIAICYVFIPFCFYTNMFKAELPALILPIIGLSYFIPLCWMSYLYKVKKCPDTTDN